MAFTAHEAHEARQLPLERDWSRAARRRGEGRARRVPRCAGCRERDARYGFRDETLDPMDDRPGTLCFECFRIEMNRRQAIAARLARGWNAHQAQLPLEETLRQLTHRRRRAQIAARHALGA